MSLRKVLLGITLLILAVSLGSPALAIRAHGGGSISGGGGSGFLPTSHWVASPIQGLTQVFPQSDGTTDANAREHWAYWDGTNDVPYDLTIGASFGAYPYVFQLVSGPPGMTIEHTTYSSFQDAQYGRVLWHPQGNISVNWSGTVSVKVTDQQNNSITISWTLSTSSATTHFVFVSPTGSGSTCTYSAPCSFTTAFGSTFAATSFPDAICYAFGGSYSGSTNLPSYTDTDTGTNGFETDSARKPNALIGVPGQTVTLDASAGPILIQLNHANDWFEENIVANGYDASAVDKLVELISSRVTFDQVSWTNSGYGTGTSANMSMFSSGGTQTPRANLFVTDSLESNRETGNVGNNFGFLDIYSYSGSLVQRSSENSPSAHLDSVFFYKSDDTESELREDYANVAGSISGFGYGQAQYSGMGDDQSDYNLGINVAQIWFGNAGAGNYTYPPFALYRNTILSGSNQAIRGPTTFNLEGPGGPGTVNLTSVTGGSLVAGTQYTCGATSVGVTGESSMTIGTNGIASQGIGGGHGNSSTITLASGDSAIKVTWQAEPGATGYNVYCEVAGSGSYTENSVGTATSFTYTGAGTALTPPSAPGNAFSSARFNFEYNALSTTFTPTPPTGTAIINTGNQVDASGTGALVCTAAGTGCAAAGVLNTTNASYSTLIGTVGYQIQ